MIWMKLHSDILDDPKLMRAARHGSKQLVLLPWLLAFAGRASDDGRLTVATAPADPEDIARGIPGVSVEQVAQALEELAQVGILVTDFDGSLRFARWAKRAGP